MHLQSDSSANSNRALPPNVDVKHESDEEIIDCEEVREGLQRQLEDIEFDLAGSYSHVAGNPSVIKALEDLHAATRRGDGESFATSQKSLTQAIQDIEGSES